MNWEHHQLYRLKPMMENPFKFVLLMMEQIHHNYFFSSSNNNNGWVFFEEHPIWSVLQILIFSFFSSETKFFYKNRKLEKKNVSGFIALTCSTSKIHQDILIFSLIHIQLLFIDKSMFTICTEVFVFTIFSFLPIFAK